MANEERERELIEGTPGAGAKMTQEDFQKLQDELDWRTKVAAVQIAKDLNAAREFGDLAENSEFDAATAAQDDNNARISVLNMQIATAVIVDAAEIKESIRRNGVGIGHVVTLQDSHGKLTDWIIVGTTATDSLRHRISLDSPAGNAMLGHRAGDVISFATPSGQRVRYSIRSVDVAPTEDEDAQGVRHEMVDGRNPAGRWVATGGRIAFRDAETGKETPLRTYLRRRAEGERDGE